MLAATSLLGPLHIAQPEPPDVAWALPGVRQHLTLCAHLQVQVSGLGNVDSQVAKTCKAADVDLTRLCFGVNPDSGTRTVRLLPRSFCFLRNSAWYTCEAIRCQWQIKRLGPSQCCLSEDVLSALSAKVLFETCTKPVTQHTCNLLAFAQAPARSTPLAARVECAALCWPARAGSKLMQLCHVQLDIGRYRNPIGVHHALLRENTAYCEAFGNFKRVSPHPEIVMSRHAVAQCQPTGGSSLERRVTGGPPKSVSVANPREPMLQIELQLDIEDW